MKKKALISTVHIDFQNIFTNGPEADTMKNITVTIYRKSRTGKDIRRDYDICRKNLLVTNLLSQIFNSRKYERQYVNLYCYPTFFVRIREEEQLKEQYKQMKELGK